MLEKVIISKDQAKFNFHDYSVNGNSFYLEMFYWYDLEPFVIKDLDEKPKLNINLDLLQGMNVRVGRRSSINKGLFHINDSDKKQPTSSYSRSSKRSDRD